MSSTCDRGLRRRNAIAASSKAGTSVASHGASAATPELPPLPGALPAAALEAGGGVGSGSGCRCRCCTCVLERVVARARTWMVVDDVDDETTATDSTTDRTPLETCRVELRTIVLPMTIRVTSGGSTGGSSTAGGSGGVSSTGCGGAGGVGSTGATTTGGAGGVGGAGDGESDGLS
jgi:hypothetical protein